MMGSDFVGIRTLVRRILFPPSHFLSYLYFLPLSSLIYFMMIADILEMEIP